MGQLAHERSFVIACLALALVGGTPVRTAELRDETLHAYTDYLAEVRRLFEAQYRSGGSLYDGIAPDVLQRLRSGGALVKAGREDGIVGIPGGLIHQLDRRVVRS